MTTLEAWQYIVNNWYAPQWRPIPQEIQRVLGLDSRLGMCGGMLVTRNGSERINQFIRAMNEKHKKG